MKERSNLAARSDAMMNEWRSRVRLITQADHMEEWGTVLYENGAKLKVDHYLLFLVVVIQDAFVSAAALSLLN